MSDNIDFLRKTLEKERKIIKQEIDKKKKEIFSTMFHMSIEEVHEQQQKTEKELWKIFNEKHKKLIEKIARENDTRYQYLKKHGLHHNVSTKKYVQIGCSLNKKLTLFDHIISECIKWEKEITNTGDENNTNDILKSFNSTKFMKLLYFICLASVNPDKPEEYNLFYTFDHFFAYKNGPVEVNVYQNRENPFNYLYDHVKDQYYFMNTKEINIPELMLERQSFFDDNLKTYQQEKSIIDRAIDNLKMRKNFPMTDINNLVELSQGKLWRETVYLEYPFMDTDFPIETRKERILFDEKCPIDKK